MDQGKFIRFALIGLPVGLLVLGVASMLYTQLKPDAPELDPTYIKRIEAASLNRKDVNRADLERFVKILSDEIGERHVGKPDSLERGAIWLESTLKGGNLGYQVERHVFQVKGKDVRNLICELTGLDRRQEVVLIGSRYDSGVGSPGANDNASGVAAVLSLAQAFAGDPQSRTIRFCFFLDEEQTGASGSQAYLESRAEKDDTVVAMLLLDSIAYFSKEEGSQLYPEEIDGEDLPRIGNFLAFTGGGTYKFRTDSARSIFSRTTGIEAVSIPDWPAKIKYHKPKFAIVTATDTAGFRDPNHRKPGDTFDKIDFIQLEKVCQGLQPIVTNWANP